MPRSQMSGEDRFVATTLQLLAWAQRNTRALVLIVIAAGIVGFAAKYYIDYKNRVREVAATEMRNLRYELEGGHPGQVIDRLRGYVAQFGSTPYGREARVLLAQALLMENRAAEAIEPARQAMGEPGSDIISTRAGFLLAAAYEEVGDTTAAIDMYRQLGRKLKLRIQKSRALEGAARLLAAHGDVDEAAAVYEELAAMTPDGAPAHGYYRMKAAELTTASATRVQEPRASEGDADQG